MLLDRTEFAQHFNRTQDGLGDKSSPLWIPEDDGALSEWFVCVKPLKSYRFKQRYWNWCNTTLSGKVRCYSSDSDNQKEWWGFTDKQDIVLWALKWN